MRLTSSNLSIGDLVPLLLLHALQKSCLILLSEQLFSLLLLLLLPLLPVLLAGPFFERAQVSSGNFIPLAFIVRPDASVAPASARPRASAGS